MQIVNFSVNCYLASSYKTCVTKFIWVLCMEGFIAMNTVTNIHREFLSELMKMVSLCMHVQKRSYNIWIQKLDAGRCSLKS